MSRQPIDCLDSIDHGAGTVSDRGSDHGSDHGAATFDKISLTSCGTSCDLRIS